MYVGYTCTSVAINVDKCVEAQYICTRVEQRFVCVCVEPDE